MLSSLLPIVILLGTANAALLNRQGSLAEGATVTTRTVSVFPGGVSSGTERIESTIPLPCIDGCYNFAGPYGFCFLFPIFPNGTANTFPSPTCNSLCNQTYYDGLTSCLNCIVANGNERPFGYSTNTSLTVQPTLPPVPSVSRGGSSASGATQIPIAQAYRNPNGLIDASQANGWLTNMTSLCNARGTTLTGASSVTALPTTTGPYAATWSSGETISRTQWTGLTQYTPPVATITATIPAARTSSNSGSNTGSSVSNAAASQSSRAAGLGTVQKPAGWLMGGAVLAWAIL